MTTAFIALAIPVFRGRSLYFRHGLPETFYFGPSFVILEKSSLLMSEGAEMPTAA